MSLSILIGLVLLLLVVAWVVRPLLAAQQVRQQLERSAEAHTLESLLFEREAVLRAIRDLEFDRDMGKLSDEDFADLDGRSRARAIEILRQLDALGVAPDAASSTDTLDAWIERAVAEVRAGKPSSPKERLRSEGTPSQADVSQV